MSKNIVLTGFMACGKSTVGKKCAKLSSRKLIDIDLYIEENEKMKISDIFAKFGEPHFRMLERKACEDIGVMEDLIISAGGGTVTFPENVESLKKNGIIVFIDTSIDTIIDRLKGCKTRPLILKPDWENETRKLYEKRLEIYRTSADITVNGNRGIETIARSILKDID